MLPEAVLSTLHVSSHFIPQDPLGQIFPPTFEMRKRRLRNGSAEASHSRNLIQTKKYSRDQRAGGGWASVLQTGLMRRTTKGCVQDRDSHTPPLGVWFPRSGLKPNCPCLSSTQMILMIEQARETAGRERAWLAGCKCSLCGLSSGTEQGMFGAVRGGRLGKRRRDAGRGEEATRLRGERPSVR